MTNLRILFFALVGAGCTAWGQVPIQNIVPWFSGGSASVPPMTPYTIGQLQRWWNYQDLTVGQTISNQWSDRVYSEPMWMMDTSKSPTNSALGVRFNAAQRLTNNLVPYASAIASTNTIGIIFTFENASTFPAVASVKSGSGAGVYVDTNAKLSWVLNSHDVTAAMAASTVIDLMIVQSNKFYFYTNGVLSLGNDANSFSQQLNSLGFDTAGDGSLKGYITHYLYWSNLVDSVGASNFHYMRVNGPLN